MSFVFPGSKRKKFAEMNIKMKLFYVIFPLFQVNFKSLYIGDHLLQKVLLDINSFGKKYRKSIVLFCNENIFEQNISKDKLCDCIPKHSLFLYIGISFINININMILQIQVWSSDYQQRCRFIFPPQDSLGLKMCI